MQHNIIQKISENYMMFSLNKSLTQSPLTLTNSLVDTDKPKNESVFCHQDINLQFCDFFLLGCDLLSHKLTIL